MLMTTPNPYFIAEIGVNHEGNIDLAKKMISEIASAGGHAAKFQTYKADLIASKDSPAYWDTEKEATETQHKLFQKYDSFSKDDYIELKKTCDDYGIDFLSTPFDTKCLDWLMPLMNIVKIASADLTNDLLLEAISTYKKPVILSVGASTDDEILYAIKLLKKNGISDITILHCMLLYPTPLKNGFLNRIGHLKNNFSKYGVRIGYSDHIPPSEANNDQLIIARSMGCVVIEKHYTYDKSLNGNDHYHAIDKNDLEIIMTRLKNCDSMISSLDSFQDKGLKIQLSAIENARRSLYYNCDLKKGMILSLPNIISKRPGRGISPKDYRQFIGRKLKKDVFEDDLLSSDHFE